MIHVACEQLSDHKIIAGLSVAEFARYVSMRYARSILRTPSKNLNKRRHE